MSGGGGDLGGVWPDSSDAPRLPDPPRLPDAAPTLPDPAGSPAGPLLAPVDVPFLPEAPRRAAEPAPEPEFDAKAMVDSQKIKVNANPAYGGMPAPTSESRAAVEQLRAEANKKRRRNRMVARLTLAAFCGVVVVAGYFAYRAFQDEAATRDQETADTADDVDSAGGVGTGDEPAALTPLGEQAEVIAGMDVLNDVATGSAGGLLGAVDDARAAVDDLNGAEPADKGPAPPATAGLPATIEASVLRYDLGSVGDPVVHHVATDLSTDTYLIATVTDGDLRDAAESGTTEVARYDATAGIATRTGRSEASLAAGPDALFVAAVSPPVLLPESAAPHARPTSIGLTGADGSPIAAEAYVVDAEAYRAADPAAATAWLTVLGLADPTAALSEGMPNLDADLLDARNTIDELVTRTDGGPVSGNPPVAMAGQIVVGWTAVADEPYVRSAYAAAGDGSFQWLYRVSSVGGPAVAAFGVR